MARWDNRGGAGNTWYRNEAGGSAVQVVAGTVYLNGFEASNAGTVDAFLQLWDLGTANVTIGATAPKQSYLIPGASSTNRGAVDREFDRPIRFGTGISYGITTTPGGTASPGTVTLNAWWS